MARGALVDGDASEQSMAIMAATGCVARCGSRWHKAVHTRQSIRGWADEKLMARGLGACALDNLIRLPGRLS